MKEREVATEKNVEDYSTRLDKVEDALEAKTRAKEAAFGREKEALI